MRITEITSLSLLCLPAIVSSYGIRLIKTAGGTKHCVNFQLNECCDSKIGTTYDFYSEVIFNNLSSGDTIFVYNGASGGNGCGSGNVYRSMVARVPTVTLTAAGNEATLTGAMVKRTLMDYGDDQHDGQGDGDDEWQEQEGSTTPTVANDEQIVMNEL